MLTEAPVRTHGPASQSLENTPLLRETINDVVGVVKAYSLWSYLAWQDIRLRYRRSRLGPFWITLSMGVFILALGTVFSRIFKMSTEEYLPFLAVGYLLWFFISTLLTEAPNLFVDNAAYLQGLKINLLVLLMRGVTRNVIIFFHNIVIIGILYIYFELWPGWAAIAALPGFLLVVANLAVVSLTLGILGARYRDIAPIVQNLVQVLFFISPITWFPKLVGENNPLLFANPITHLLDLVRSPLLGKLPPISSWWVAVGLLAVNLVIALVLYVSKSRRVVFWV